MRSTCSVCPMPFQSATAPRRLRDGLPVLGSVGQQGSLALPARAESTLSSTRENLPPGTAPGHAALSLATGRWLGHAAPRRRALTRRLVGVHSRSAVGPFFSSAECPFHTPPVDSQSELFLQSLCQ